MMQSLVVREWGEIHLSKSDNKMDEENTIDRIFVNSSAFKSLAKLAESDDKQYRFLKFKKSTVLKVQNFVGVITTPDGTQIEILPKINKNKDSDEETAKKSRIILTKMLKVVNNLELLESTKADVQIKNQPLLEVLITLFLACADEIIKKGIRKDYHRIDEQEKFLKGQLQTHKQLNEPPHKQHLFHIEYDIFSPNRPENRLIHSALLQVLKWSKTNQNQKLAKHCLSLFDGVPHSDNYKNDFAKWSKNRDMNYYKEVLPWLKLVLNQQSPFTLKDKNAGISFLIPMEKLFEKYVAKMLHKKLSPKGYSIKTEPKKYLTMNPDAFQMKPDIAVCKDDKIVRILDTKWKLIDENATYCNGNNDKKKDISQSDVYQLFAYGKKYNIKKVVLIYPKWDKFSKSFSYRLEDELMLKIDPFDVEASLNA
ncbi:McrC family protein [Bathymodiolus heckerae thiotrophic gill symbiont]|uniref:McrC family protein n=1 Tax=Bathymodiolus heckerae thiotrophic gill symbiont TaxID=1052212 RepID=UPI0010FF4C00|nr:McrC family protein [Bathymodiolus heckerae thiotrophic gill symbiont]